MFIHGKLIREIKMATKPEIIAIVLSKLDLQKKDMFADIGCGSGAVSIEAAKKLEKIYAIDMRKEAIETARYNFKEHGVAEKIELIQGEASEVLRRLPMLDCAFLGGTKNLEGVLPLLREKVRRRFIVNAVRIETAARIVTLLKELGVFKEIIQVQISRGYELGGETMFKPENQIYMILGEKRT